MNSKNVVYKFIDIEDKFNIENLTNRELFCRYFDSYNDPYEGHFGVSTDWPCVHNETEKLRLLIAMLMPERAEFNTQSKLHMSAFIKNQNNVGEIVRDIICREANKFRICSFTRRWNNILMWSHYSKGGSGAALMFDHDMLTQGEYIREPNSNLDINCTNSPLGWVRYKNSIPTINSINVIDALVSKSENSIKKVNSDIVEKCILTKHVCWRYEQESRLILKLEKDIDKRPILYRYPKDALIGVLVGNRCSDDGYVGLASSLDGDVKIYLSCQSKSRYKYEVTHEFLAKDIKSGKVKIEKKLQ